MEWLHVANVEETQEPVSAVIVQREGIPVQLAFPCVWEKVVKIHTTQAGMYYIISKHNLILYLYACILMYYVIIRF